MSFVPLMEDQKGSQSIIPIINSIAKDVRTNSKIKDSKKEIIRLAKNAISDKEFLRLNDDSKTIGKFVKSNLEDFENNEMSLIQEYDFVDKLIAFHYWKNWKCDLGSGLKIIAHSLDTMTLFEMEEYDIPISVDNGKNTTNPYLILSNSLQKNDKNTIHLKTGNAQSNIVNKEFEITMFNKLTGEEFKEKKSVKYKIIKADKLKD